jgi:hypothetical protein
LGGTMAPGVAAGARRPSFRYYCVKFGLAVLSS